MRPVMVWIFVTAPWTSWTLTAPVLVMMLVVRFRSDSFSSSNGMRMSIVPNLEVAVSAPKELGPDDQRFGGRSRSIVPAIVANEMALGSDQFPVILPKSVATVKSWAVKDQVSRHVMSPYWERSVIT